MLVSRPIVDEVVTVCSAPSFERSARITQALETDAVMVSPKTHLKVILDDPDDDRILECALEGGANYLVSGDHHLLDLKRYRQVRIVTARQFLAILGSQK